jgi:hypothetical protein
MREIPRASPRVYGVLHGIHEGVLINIFNFKDVISIEN